MSRTYLKISENHHYCFGHKYQIFLLPKENAQFSSNEILIWVKMVEDKRKIIICHLLNISSNKFCGT